MNYTYSKDEKLKSRKLIKELFENGKSVTVFPLRMIYLKKEHLGKFRVKAGVSVSKRNLKRAVDRNRIKRLLRESYRLNKYLLYLNLEEQYVMLFIYLAKEKKSFSLIEDKMKELMQKFLKRIKKQN